MKVLAIFDADGTLWELDGAIWNATIVRHVGDLINLNDGRVLKLRQGVRGGLKALRNRGVYTAIASHNIDLPWCGVRAALAAFELTSHFDVIAIRNSSDKNAMIRDICTDLKVDPRKDKVFFIDDAGNHVENARKLGVDAHLAKGDIEDFLELVLEAAVG